MKKVENMSNYELNIKQVESRDIQQLLNFLSLEIHSIEFQSSNIDEKNELHSIKTILDLINLKMNQIYDVFEDVVEKKEDDDFD